MLKGAHAPEEHVYYAILLHNVLFIARRRCRIFSLTMGGFAKHN